MTNTATVPQQAPAVYPASIDALRAGDVVTLRRYFPAGYRGANHTASMFVGQLTIARLVRHEDGPHGPSWYLEGREEAMRGCWAVGYSSCGMVTTLERVRGTERIAGAGCDCGPVGSGCGQCRPERWA